MWRELIWFNIFLNNFLKSVKATLIKIKIDNHLEAAEGIRKEREIIWRSLEMLTMVRKMRSALRKKKPMFHSKV